MYFNKIKLKKNEKSQHVSLSFPEVELLIKSNYSYTGYVTADCMYTLVYLTE